jgi:hypothetical protein
MQQASSLDQFDLWPAVLSFRYLNATTLQASAFFADFVRNAPHRVAALQDNARMTPGFEEWTADFSPESFLSLGRWFKAVGAMRRLRPEDVHVEVLNPRLAQFEIDIMRDAIRADVTHELTPQSMMIAIDIGIFCGEAVRHYFPSIQWKQCLAKCDVNFNHPILLYSELTPMSREVLRAAHRIIEKGPAEEDAFQRIFGRWLTLAVLSENQRQRKSSKH